MARTKRRPAQDKLRLKGGKIYYGKGHRSQIKRERNAVKDLRPSAKLSYARVSVQKACFILDAIRGKDLNTALGIVTYNPRYASTLVKKLLESAAANAENNNNMDRDTLLCGRVLRKQGTYHEEDTPQSSGQGLSYREAHQPHHGDPGREEVIGGGKHGTES